MQHKLFIPYLFYFFLQRLFLHQVFALRTAALAGRCLEALIIFLLITKAKEGATIPLPKISSKYVLSFWY